jgi:hypothetical protein
VNDCDVAEKYEPGHRMLADCEAMAADLVEDAQARTSGFGYTEGPCDPDDVPKQARYAVGRTMECWVPIVNTDDIHRDIYTCANDACIKLVDPKDGLDYYAYMAGVFVVGGAVLCAIGGLGVGCVWGCGMLRGAAGGEGGEGGEGGGGERREAMPEETQGGGHPQAVELAVRGNAAAI